MNIDLTSWINNIFISTSILTILVVWGIIIYFGYQSKDYKVVLRSLTVLSLFFVWFLIVLIQEWLATNVSTLQIYSITYFVGYFVFPLTLIALWRVVYPYIAKPLNSILRIKSYRLVMIYTSTVYGLFYLFASGMISIVLSSKIVLPTQSYIKFSESYGPLTIWPNIEFWVPVLHLFGVISIAGILMLLSLSALIGIGIILILYQWRIKKNMDMKVMSSTIGSSIAVTTTCFVSCTLPAVYPLLVLFFGTATADPLSRILADGSGLLVNVTQMAVLSIMVGSVIFAGYRVRISSKGVEF